MAAYLIANISVNDPERYRDYVAGTPDIIARHGGRFLVRGGATEVLEGDPQPDRVIVVEFPSMQDASDFYNSADYQALARIRQECSDGDFFFVEGAP